jgi:hypothetical protein
MGAGELLQLINSRRVAVQVDFRPERDLRTSTVALDVIVAPRRRAPRFYRPKVASKAFGHRLALLMCQCAAFAGQSACPIAGRRLRSPGHQLWLDRYRLIPRHRQGQSKTRLGDSAKVARAPKSGRVYRETINPMISI